MQARGGARGRVGTTSTPAAARGRAPMGFVPRPEAVVRTLHTRGRATARGAEIARDMDALADDYFGTPNAPEGPYRAAPRDDRISRTDTFLGAPPPSLLRGPRDPNGRLMDVSDRNLLCMDVRGTLAVVGSADHGLKIFDAATGKQRRNLYTKSCGHTEWVTTCSFLSDGRVLSGGMDSKLCLWHASAPRCTDLLGHTGSISHVMMNASDMAISGSYDRTLRVWDCQVGGSLRTTLQGHGQPIMTFDWLANTLVSGDRRGEVVAWDLAVGSKVGSISLGRGQVSAIGHLSSPTFGTIWLLGDQGGVLTAMDWARSPKPIFQQNLHPGGSLGGVSQLPLQEAVVTYGADRRMLCLDAKVGFKKLHEWSDHRDFIYSMETAGSLVLSGAGNGWLMAHSAVDGKCLYGLGASTAAVRAIAVTPQMLLAAGDDGKLMAYDL